MSPRLVTVDHSPEATNRYGEGWAVVGVDVFRATTLICTTVAAGRRCIVAGEMDEALALAAGTPGSLLAGERAGMVLPEFDLGNSPAAIAARHDIERPLVLVTSSGTPLLLRAATASAVYAACLRNVTAQVVHLLSWDLDVAVIGAGTRGEPRREDQFAAALIADGLVQAGYQCEDSTSRSIVDNLRRPVEWCAQGRSGAFLRRTGSRQDIDFVLNHQDDVPMVFQVHGNEVLGLRIG